MRKRRAVRPVPRGRTDHAGAQEGAPTAEFAAKHDVDSVDLGSIDSSRNGKAMRVTRRSPTWSPETLYAYVRPRQAEAAAEYRRLHEAVHARHAPMRAQTWGDRVDNSYRPSAPPIADKRKSKALLKELNALFAHDPIACALVDCVVLGNGTPADVARSALVVERIGWKPGQRLMVGTVYTLRNVLELMADRLHLPNGRPRCAAAAAT